MHRRFLTATIVTVATACAGAANSTTAQPPNIILILADDLGYGDLSCYPKGQGWDEQAHTYTPNIDALAGSGARCTNAYATSMICAPSRVGLITGQYQQHLGYYAFGETTVPFPKTVKTIAEALREVGYATALIGKWHISSSPDSGPLQRGFDRFYGFIGGQHDYYESNLGEAQPGVGNAPDAWILDQDKPVKSHKYLTNEFTGQAIAFIDQTAARQKRFFLYLSYSAPHPPLQVPWKYLEPRVNENDIAGIRKKFPPRALARAMIHCLDDNVGRLLAHLDKQNLAGNTLVIFSSDNGGSDGGPINTCLQHNGGLKGRKGTFYEGGIRVPLIVRYPGKIPAGTIYHGTLTHMDIYPATLAAAGATPEIPQNLAGKNILPHLAGNDTANPHSTLHWTINSPSHWAIRDGDWKLILDDTHPETLGQKKNLKAHYKLQLYNLAADANETTDLIDKHPGIAKHLQQLHDQFVAASIPSIYTDEARRAHRQFIADREKPGSRHGNQPAATGSPGHWQGADAKRRSTRQYRDN